jgi:hypothetical protein
MIITVDTDTLRGLAKIWRRRAENISKAGPGEVESDEEFSLRIATEKCAEELDGFVRILEEDETLP